MEDSGRRKGESKGKLRDRKGKVENIVGYTL
jgi:hypothetical protein